MPFRSAPWVDISPHLPPFAPEGALFLRRSLLESRQTAAKRPMPSLRIPAPHPPDGRTAHRRSPRRRALCAAVAWSGVAVLLALPDAAAERIVLPNGDVYEGDVVDGARSGRGTYTSNQHRYEGEFRAGKMNGAGVLQWADGRIYEGAFANDKRHGRGRLRWPDGRILEGVFVNDQREGPGTLTWPNGNAYRGDFRAGQITGRGRLVWDNEDVYEGDFINGQRFGWGVQTWRNGNRYAGEWRSNRREGIGAYHWKDGTVYYGQFRANRMHGVGVKHGPDGGDRYFQHWREGALASESIISADARCQLTLDGHAWMFSSDRCVNGHAHGRGAAVRLDGEAFVVDGHFVLGRMVRGEIGWLTVPGVF